MDIFGSLRNLLEFLKYGIVYESKVFEWYQNCLLKNFYLVLL